MNEFKFRGGRGVDYVNNPGDLGMFTKSGQWSVMRRPFEEETEGEDVGPGGGAAAGATEEVPEKLPVADLYSRSTLLSVQYPEAWIVLDATGSFDPDDINPKFRKPINDVWDIDWKIVGKSSLQDQNELRADRDQNQGNVRWDAALDCAEGRCPNMKGELSDVEIIKHLGISRIVEMGSKLDKADAEKRGMQLARKLLRKVAFDKGLYGTWNIELKIKDDTGTDGWSAIPFMVANCEPPELRIKWEDSIDLNLNRTLGYRDLDLEDNKESFQWRNMPLVNPSDKIKIQANVWYFGMGDVRRSASSSTKKLWTDNKKELKVTWESVRGISLYRSLDKDKAAEWSKTALEQGSEVLETKDGLEVSNLVIAKWMLEPADAGVATYTKYKFRLRVNDICSTGRKPIVEEIKLIVNSPPYDGYMWVDRRNGTANMNPVENKIDVFKVLLLDWKDTDLPISYTYKYILDDGTGFQSSEKKPCDYLDKNEETMCQEEQTSSAGFLPDNNATLALPAGNVLIVGYVMDSYGAKTRVMYLDKEAQLCHGRSECILNSKKELLEDGRLANVTVYQPPFNESAGGKGAALANAADSLAGGAENATADDALAGVNSVVGMLNDANASVVACCNGNARKDPDTGEPVGCQLAPEGCDFVNDNMCAVIGCECDVNWEGEDCDTAGGEVLEQRKASRQALLGGMGAANFSDPNASAVAEGGSKSMDKVSGGANEMGDEGSAQATNMLGDMVGSSSSGGAIGAETGGPMLAGTANLIDVPAPPGAAGGQKPLGDNLAGSLDSVGGSMLGANVPGENAIGMASPGIQMSVQVQTIDGLRGYYFKVKPAENCSLGPQFEFPQDMLGATLVASKPLNVNGQQWKENRFGENTGPAPAPGPSSFFDGGALDDMDFFEGGYDDEEEDEASSGLRGANATAPSPEALEPWQIAAIEQQLAEAAAAAAPSPSGFYNVTGLEGAGKKERKLKPPPVTGMALGTKIKGLNFPNHIAFTTPLTKKEWSLGIRGAKCRFQNPETQEWSTDGAFAIGFLRIWHCCERGCDPHFQLLCASSHLTDFSSDTALPLPDTNLPSPGQIGGLLDECCDNAIHILVILLALTLFNWFGIYYGIKADRRDYDIYKAFMRVDFLKKGILNGLLNEDDSFFRVCWETLRATHKLMSFVKPPLCAAVVFRRPERVVCIYAHILTSMGVNSLFFGKDPDSIPKKISKAIITSVLMFPTSSLFPNSFIGLHTLVSKTYRQEEEILKYDDVAELAAERLPDKFVAEALGMDLHAHHKAKHEAREEELEEAEQKLEADTGMGFLKPIPQMRIKHEHNMKKKAKMMQDLANQGGGGESKAGSVWGGKSGSAKVAPSKPKKSSWKRWEVDEDKPLLSSNPQGDSGDDDDKDESKESQGESKAGGEVKNKKNKKKPAASTAAAASSSEESELSDGADVTDVTDGPHSDSTEFHTSDEEGESSNAGNGSSSDGSSSSSSDGSSSSGGSSSSSSGSSSSGSGSGSDSSDSEDDETHHMAVKSGITTLSSSAVTRKLLKKGEEQKKKIAEKAARKRRAKKHLLSVMHLKSGMDAAFALESQEDQEAQMQAMRDRIEDYDAKVEFEKLAKEAEERRAESDMNAEARALQVKAREKKLKEAEEKRRQHLAKKQNKLAFGAAGGGMLSKLKHKSKITKEEKAKKRHFEEHEKWNYYEDSKGVKHKKKTIEEIRADPANHFQGYEMDCPHVSNMDIDYELDLLEFEGICERERALPVTKMRYALHHDRRWLIMVRRMEFELYITMSLERKVQAAILWFIVACYCGFAVFMNLLFGMKFPATKAREWIDTATGTLVMGYVLVVVVVVVGWWWWGCCCSRCSRAFILVVPPSLTPLPHTHPSAFF